MESTLHNFQLLRVAFSCHAVDKPMLTGNPYRPKTRKITFKGFGFT